MKTHDTVSLANHELIRSELEITRQDLEAQKALTNHLANLLKQHGVDMSSYTEKVSGWDVGSICIQETQGTAAKRATPGPWRVDPMGRLILGGLGGKQVVGRFACVRRADVNLMAMAPVMAKLLYRAYMQLDDEGLDAKEYRPTVRAIKACGITPYGE